MINTQTLKGNLINQDYSTAFTLNQGDKGVPFKVELLENGTPYTLQSSDIITIEWLKPNGNPFLQEGDISYGTTYIEFTTPEAIAQYSGSGSFNIIITNGDVRKGTIRREYKVVSTSMKPGSVSEDIVTDAITELRSLSAEIASTVQNNQELINNNTAATKSDIATVNSSLDNKANKNEVGAPLTATNISEMTDKTKVYVNTTDGNWYSWNGSDWVIGGVYNSIAIGNGTVTPVKTSFLKQTKNLFDKFTVKKGYYWNVSTGEQVNSDFSYVIIPCEKGKKYIATGTSYNVCLFNSQGTRVGADNNSNGMANCIISTESYSEVAYFILSFRHATYPIDTYMVVEGEVLPSEYIEYGFKFDGKILFDNNSNILNVKKDGTGDFTRVYDAIKYAEQYANKDNVFNILIYEGIAFLIVFAILEVLLKVVVFASGILESLLRLTIVFGLFSKILGLFFGFIEYYVIIFAGLFMLNCFSNTAFLIKDSSLATNILNNTPVLTEQFKEPKAAIDEILDLSNAYKNDKEGYNAKAFEILIKYNIISQDQAKKLISKKKIEIPNAQSILENFKNQVSEKNS